MRDLDQLELDDDAKQCLERIYGAVGTHSTQQLAEALGSDSGVEALLLQVRDDHNPIALAAENGDERLLEVFRSHGVLLDGWFGDTRQNLFHAMAEQRADETVDAEQWLVERLNAGWLVTCPDIRGRTPLALLVEHSRNKDEDFERLARWLAWNQQASELYPWRQTEGMFTRLERVNMLGAGQLRAGSRRDVDISAPIDGPWEALVRRHSTWRDEIADVLKTGGYPLPPDLLLRWADTTMRWPNVDRLDSKMVLPNASEACRIWLKAQGEAIDPTLLDKQGWTVMERALMKLRNPIAGWPSGLACAAALLELFAAQHTIQALAPRLPDILCRLVLAGDPREQGGLVGDLTFNRLKPFWERAASMEPSDIPGPIPSTMSFEEALKFKMGRQAREAAIEQAKLLFNTAKGMGATQTKSMRL